MADYAEQMVKNCAIKQAFPPIDTTGAIQTGTAISLKGWDHCTIILSTGAWAAGTSAVTLTQDTAITPTVDVKALAFTHYYTNVAAVGSNTMVDTACASTFNIAATANADYVIEIDADTLDTANNFDCLRVICASPGANADLLAGVYILSKGRYVGASGTIKDATID